MQYCIILVAYLQYMQYCRSSNISTVHAVVKEINAILKFIPVYIKCTILYDDQRHLLGRFLSPRLHTAEGCHSGYVLHLFQGENMLLIQPTIKKAYCVIKSKKNLLFG